MKKYLLPLGSVLMIILMSIFFVLPKLRLVSERREKLKLEKERLARLTTKAALLEGFDEYELEKKAAVVENALPSQKAIAMILTTLSSLSKETGVALVGFRVSPGELALAALATVDFEASYQGDLSQIESLLEAIREVTPVMKVVGFSIKQDKTILKIAGYFSPLPSSLGKIDAPLAKISEQEKRVYEEVAQLKTYPGPSLTVLVGKEDLFSEF